MKFSYKIKTGTGQIIEGVKEAPDRFTLARDMRAAGNFIISARLLETTSRWSFKKINNLFGSVKLHDKIVFAANLSAMISAGLSLSRSLDVMARQTSNKYFKTVLIAIQEKIEQGESLSGALKSFPKIFPEVFVAMVAAGEESGDLPGSLKIVSVQMQKSYELRRKVKGAMIYPSIIVAVIIIIGILMMIFLVPTLTATFRELGVELPLSTRLIVLISDFLSGHIIFNLILVLTTLVILIGFSRTAKGRHFGHYLMLHLPLISPLTKKFNAAVIMRTISSLITAGISMVETLKITGRVVQNTYFKAVLAIAADKVQSGVALSAVFQSKEKLLPVLMGELTEVGEETGNLPDMLMSGAVFFEEEVDQATKNISTVIEPVLMVMIGLAVGFFAISMIGPLYSLTSAL